MVRTQIQLTEEQINSLKRLANKLHVSLAELVREGVDKILQTSGEPSVEESKRRAIEAAGKFRSGVRDLSTKHDRHLVKAFKS